MLSEKDTIILDNYNKEITPKTMTAIHDMLEHFDYRAEFIKDSITVYSLSTEDMYTYDSFDEFVRDWVDGTLKPPMEEDELIDYSNWIEALEESCK